MPFLEDEKEQSLRLAASSAPKLPTTWWDEAEAASKPATPKFMDAADFDAQMAAQDRQAQKEANAAVEVERDLPGEVGASLVRGGLGLAKLVPQVAKIIGSDVAGPLVKGITGRDLAKEAFTPMIEGLEDIAESPEWKPSKAAGGAPIDLERIISNPGEVIGQITSQIANPNFWAAQLPEGALSMVPAIVGAWAPRAVAYAGKLGTALEAANAAGKTAEATAIAAKIDRLSKIGMYGASMAMEAGQGEEKVREYEEKTGEKISWGSRVASILGTGIVAGGLEAFSLGRVLPSALLGRKAASPLAVIENVLNGKGGREIVNKVLAGVATEGLTEGAQSIVENAFPRGFFDKNQKLLEGVVESMLIGAALGGLGGGAESVSTHREAGAFARESGQFSQEFQDTAARIQDSIKKAQDEYYSQFKPMLPEKPPEPALASGVERPGPQPAELSPEEQQQAIFGGELGQIAEGQPTVSAAVDALAPLVGSTERAERFYDLYQQGDAATALQEFPEHSTFATEQQKQAAITPAEREAARGLPSAFTGKARPTTPPPLGVTGMEAATRATTPAPEAAGTPTPGSPPLPGTAASGPTTPSAPMGVTGGMAQEVATKKTPVPEVAAPTPDVAPPAPEVVSSPVTLEPTTPSPTNAPAETEIDPQKRVHAFSEGVQEGVTPPQTETPEGVDVRKSLIEFTNKLSEEHNRQIEEAKTANDHDALAEISKRAGTIAKISGLHNFTDEALPDEIGKLPKWARDEWNQFLAGSTPAPAPAPTGIVQPAASGEVAPESQTPIESPVAKPFPSGIVPKKTGPITGAKPVAPRGAGLHPGITGKPAQPVTPAPKTKPLPTAIAPKKVARPPVTSMTEAALKEEFQALRDDQTDAGMGRRKEVTAERTYRAAIDEFTESKANGYSAAESEGMREHLINKYVNREPIDRAWQKIFGAEEKAPWLDKLANLSDTGWLRSPEGGLSDQEVAIMERAMDAGLVKAEKADKKAGVVYKRLGDLKTWLKENTGVTYQKGDRVSWKERGKTLTGTLKGAPDRFGNVDINVDQTVKAGGVPVGRVSMDVKVETLTKLEAAPKAAPAAAASPTPAAEPSAAAHVKIANQVKDHLEKMQRSGASKSLTSANLYNWADEAYGGTMAQGTYTPKDAYDAMELGVNQFIQAHPEIYNPHSANPADVVKQLEALTKMLPTQTRRTGEMDEFQQFSTPPALAYMVNWVANIGQNDVALEPSGGIGGIAVFASNAGAQEVIVNELSPRRAELLREMGFDQVFTENAEQLNNVLPKTVKPTVVVMNPPFSATAGRMMGKRISETGAQHIEQALKRLEPGGRLVAIVGRGMAFDKPTFKTWWGKIKKEYNVLANVGISGKNYTKYGTSFDNQILVIDKTGSTTQQSVTGAVERIEDLIPLLEGVKDARQVANQPSSQKGVAPAKTQAGNKPTPLPTPGVVETGGKTPEAGITGGGTVGDVGPSDSSVKPGVNAGVRGKSGGQGGTVAPAGAVQSGETSTTPEPGAGGVGATGHLDDGERPVGGQSAPGASGSVSVEATDGQESKEKLTDSIYEDYRPQRLKVPGAKPHPAKLVESAAMSSVKPPVPTYKPKIPQNVISDGLLSDSQMEAVVYAGQAHSQMLESGERRGFAIGDGTGVGKGREIAGIFQDNWNQGRKKGVWISQNNSLLGSAQRDVAGIGWDPKIVKPMPGNYNPISGDSGILFVGYDTAKSRQAASKDDKTFIPKSRMDQIVTWLGEDFDGVIAFDEAHNMNKSTSPQNQFVRGQKASQRALAGVELQKRLPNARVVYVSATMGEEVEHFAFADRLGLWGPGTEFANKSDFLSKVASGGVASMEVVARDMKALGSYMARSLSFDGVKYERLTHELSLDQTTTYDELAKVWQKVLENVDAAMDTTGAAADSKAKMSARAQFWGYNQRFFNQVTTALTMPSVLKALETDLANGHSPVIQLVNTYGDAQDKAIKNRGEDVELDEIDMTPRQMLAQYLEKSFPVVQYEEYTDDNGETQVRVALDSNGKEILNQEAMDARDKLLEGLGMIKFPDNPIDQIINKFGPGVVAEITGRKQRLIQVKGETRLEKRGDAAVRSDVNAYNDGKKRILIFSQKGDTGASYHADLSIKNQALRRHYLLQAGWQAKRALQGFGRTHRTNQAQAPEYILVETNIKGHKRFISSIARRLDQLGALTKGQRQTGSSGLLKASDNLETTHAQIAVERFVDDLLAGQIQGIESHEFEAQTGWRLTYTSGGSVYVNYPTVKQFMNRLLAMQVASQDTVYEAFDQRHQDVITRAADQGTLDFGMETIFPDKGGRIEKVSEELVYTEPRSGAETKVVAFDITNPTKPMIFDQADGTNTHFFQNKSSGNVWAFDARPRNSTKQDGTIKEEYVGIGQRQGARQWVESNILSNKDKWIQLKKADAKPLWQAAVAKLPKESTDRLNMITGTLLPIWNRLTGSTRVKRLQTQDGIKYLGRVIPNSDLSDTLTALGATPQVKNLEVKNSGDIYEKVLDNNWIVTLANGWKFRRALVSGEQRIELVGARPEDLPELRQAGLIVERISYETRAFIPVDKGWTKTNSDLKAIDAIIKRRPVVEAAPRFADQGSARYSLAGRAGLGAGPAPGEGSTITLQAVQERFGGVKVHELEGGKGFHLTLPNGKLLMILTGQDLAARRDEVLKTYGREMKAGEWVAGEWRQMSVGGVVALAKAAGIRTLDHETFHAACDLVLRQKELDAILKKYGDWETAARAYETWKPAESHTFFQKIFNFFKRLAGLLGPTADGTFAKIKSGEVWTRTAAGHGTGATGAFNALRPTDPEAVLIQYHQDLMAADPDKKSLWRRFRDKDPALKASWKEMAEKTYDQVVDRFAPGERAQDKLAKAGITLPAGEQFTSTIGFWRGQEGWNHEAVLGAGVYYDPVETAASGESFFSGATPTRVGDSLFKRVDPIRDLAKARGLENKEVFRDLRLMMVAQRDLELAGETGARAPGAIKGVRPDESRAALQALETKYGTDFTQLQGVADGIREWADQAILQRLLQGGVIARDLYDKIKARNQAYIPFMRLMDELDNYIEATGGGRVIKEIKGSERAIVDPFQVLIELSAKANYAYAKNRMFRSLYQMGQASPEMGIEIIKSKIVPSGMTRVDKWDPLGRSGWAMQAETPRIKKGYAFSPLAPEKGTVPFYKDGKRVWLKLPPDMYGMTQNLLPQDLGLLMRILKWPADVLRTGAVTTPEFGLIKNPIRDMIQAWVFNRAGFSPLKWFRDLYLLLSKNPATIQMRSEMAVGGGFMATLAQSTVEEKITAADIEGKKKNIWYAAHPVDALRALSAYLENLTRFSLYKQARENGFSHAEAVHEARRTTLDFRRLGGHPVARYLNMIIPFWNANIQGADKLITELRGPNKAAVMRRLGTLMAASVGLALLFHGDDRLKELEDWEKNYFWHIPLGKTGPIIRLPKPFEAGIMFGSIPERLVEVAMGDNTTGLQAAVKVAVDALTPEVIPAILRPLVELKSNYNFFLGRPIEDASLQSLPVKLRSKPWTSSLAKAISAHGGNLIGLSPVKVEHFVRSFSGGLGANYYFPGADILLRKAGVLEDLPNPQQDAIERAFGIRALFSKPPAGYRAKSVGDFFENVQAATQADQGWKLLWNTGSMDKLDAFLKDNPEAMFARVARKQMAELGKIKKERNAIHLSSALTSEQKKVKLDALDEKIVTLARAGNALMDPAVAEAVKMPARKGMDFDSYKKMTSEFVGDAYDIIQKNLPKIIHMEEAQRQRYLIKIIRQAREDYKPILKKPKDATKPESPYAKPTRAERASWQSVMGFRKAKPGEVTGYRLKEEAP